MSRYLPVVLGVLAIVGLTTIQIRMSDRFADTNISAEQQAKLLDNIPNKIGDWVGEDMKIDETVRQTAGAVGAVSRVYRNSRTGDKVDLWLIVGHGRAIAAHTPNICYRASGFEMRAVENSLYPMVFPEQREAPFWTNTFFKEDVTGRRLVRVFWSWYNPESPDNEGKVVWEAPENARWHFGNTRALYKMYFTSEMKDQLETADLSSCLSFAREFMPVVNEALANVHVSPGAAANATAATDSNAIETPADDTTVEPSPQSTSLFDNEAPATEAALSDSSGAAQPVAPPGTAAE